MRSEGLPYEKFEEIQLKAKEYEQVEQLRHKWPRGLRQKLINLDGGKARCFFCWSQQPSLHIAHIDFYDEKGVFHYAYELDTMHSVKHLVLLCDSCHGKIDKAASSESPFKTAFMLAFKERLLVLNEEE
jgi:hypothetical protein